MTEAERERGREREGEGGREGERETFDQKERNNFRSFVYHSLALSLFSGGHHPFQHTYKNVHTLRMLVVACRRTGKGAYASLVSPCVCVCVCVCVYVCVHW